MSSDAFVSVVMPVYNSERFLSRAIDSILNQTYCDFELITIDDGSLDGSEYILGRYAKLDPRIHVYYQEHSGVAEALNLGCSIAQGTYIAIMHADDISFPCRLAIQVSFLEKSPEVAVLGTGAYQIDDAGRLRRYMRVQADELAIRWLSLFTSPLIHPTVMLRRKTIIDQQVKYMSGSEFDAVEDYDLWTRLMRSVKIVNVTQPLLYYRVHRSSVTATKSHVQTRNRNKIALRTIRETLPEVPVTFEDVAGLTALLDSSAPQPLLRDLPYQRLAELFGLMLDAFLAQYAKQQASTAVRRLAAQQAARVIYHKPYARGWSRLLGRWLAAEPSLASTIIGDFCSTVVLKLYYNLSRHVVH